MLQFDEFNFPAGARDIEAHFFFVNYVAVAVCVVGEQAIVAVPLIIGSG